MFRRKTRSMNVDFSCFAVSGYGFLGKWRHTAKWFVPSNVSCLFLSRHLEEARRGS